MITFASVDFPEPFGPMSACVSPWVTVRSIPCRMSLPSTDAFRPSISSTAGSLIVHLDQDVVVLDLHGENLHRNGRRQRAGLAGCQIERRAVLGTLDRLQVQVDFALVQEVVRVRADGVDRTEALVAEVHHSDRAVVDLEATDLAG